jgi:hypothetical protein
VSTTPLLSGFSIVRNAIRYGYPVAESLRSLAPLVEELVVAVGRSEDDTLDLVQSLGTEIPQLRIVETVWDEALRHGGRVLAEQTNVALSHCRHPWAFYLQSDEVLHEADYPRVRAALTRWHDDPAVDALRFRFLHFEGTYGYVNYLRYWSQCRIVRTTGGVRSVGDAAGFGRVDGARLRTRPTGAKIYHYGWARPPAALQRKTLAFLRLYLDDGGVARHAEQLRDKALGDVDIAFRFHGTHPGVMRQLLEAQDWDVDPALRPPLGSPLLARKFYARLLRKWGLLSRPK